MLLFYLASQLAAPTSVGPPTWFKADDYPISHIQAGRSFELKIRLTVKADGSLQGCSIEHSSGDKEFDKYNCALVLSRAKFSPALAADGTPVIGVYRARVSWKMDDRKPKSGTGDLELTVDKLPSGVESPAMVQLAIAVDSDGRPSDCAAGNADQNAALARIACAQLVQSFRAIPARLPTGELVPSVQTASVTFVSR